MVFQFHCQFRSSSRFNCSSLPWTTCWPSRSRFDCSSLPVPWTTCCSILSAALVISVARRLGRDQDVTIVAEGRRRPTAGRGGVIAAATVETGAGRQGEQATGGRAAVAAFVPQFAPELAGGGMLHVWPCHGG